MGGAENGSLKAFSGDLKFSFPSETGDLSEGSFSGPKKPLRSLKLKFELSSPDGDFQNLGQEYVSRT